MTQSRQNGRIRYDCGLLKEGESHAMESRRPEKSGISMDHADFHGHGCVDSLPGVLAEALVEVVGAGPDVGRSAGDSGF